MTDVRGDQVYEMTEDECWALLERGALGRLATAVGELVDVFAVNYGVVDRRVLFKTDAGTKLASLTINAHVAFETDGFDERTAWSVVVKGVARVVEAAEERLEAERVPIVSWLPTQKTRIVAIEPTEITGRGFVRGPEPDPDWY